MIRASDINRHCFCPRSIYLTEVAGILPKITLELVRGQVGHAVRREIHMSQRQILAGSGGDYHDALNENVDDAFSRLRSLMGCDWRSECALVADDVRAEVIGEIRILAQDLEAMVDDVGLKRAIEIVSPWRVDLPLESRSLNLCGRVDKVMRDDTLWPVDIRTGAVVDFDGGDAIQLCAYGMLLEEAFAQKVPYGLIEYTRSVEKKPVVFTEKLKSQVLNIRDEIRDILSGAEPPVCAHGEPKKCEACTLKDECYST